MNDINKLSDQELENISGGVTQDQALAVALKHAGLTKNQIVGLKRIKKGTENGIPVFEIEFKKDGWEYEYDIAMSDGAIVKCERDFDD